MRGPGTKSANQNANELLITPCHQFVANVTRCQGWLRIRSLMLCPIELRAPVLLDTSNEQVATMRGVGVDGGIRTLGLQGHNLAP